MGRGKALNVNEKAKIDTFKEDGYSIRNISEKICKSKSIVHNYLKDVDNYGKNMRGRIPGVLSPQDKRAILRAAANSAQSPAKIKGKVGVNASLSTVKRVIKSVTHLILQKIKKKPSLNVERKLKRLQFAREHMVWKKEWHQVVFSDEEKFNKDGRQDHNQYFHDLLKEEKF